MYLSNEGHKVEVNTNFYFLLKTNDLGIDDFKVTLFNKNQIDTYDIDFDVEEYITYLDKENPKEDYDEGTYTIEIDDVSNFYEKKYARIKDNYYLISKVDGDNNELTFETPLKENITTDDEVYSVSYNEMLCLYQFKLTPEKIGNYMLVIHSDKYNISKFEALDVLPSVINKVVENKSEIV